MVLRLHSFSFTILPIFIFLQLFSQLLGQIISLFIGHWLGVTFWNFSDTHVINIVKTSSVISLVSLISISRFSQFVPKFWLLVQTFIPITFHTRQSYFFPRHFYVINCYNLSSILSGRSQKYPFVLSFLEVTDISNTTFFLNFYFMHAPLLQVIPHAPWLLPILLYIILLCIQFGDRTTFKFILYNFSKLFSL